MKAMKGKGRPELSWEARSPKISILPPVYIKKRGKIKRGIVKRQRQRTLTWWWERTHVHGGKEEQTVFQLRMKAEAETPKSVDERVPWASSFVPIYRINPQNQRLDRRERERERENPTTKMKLWRWTWRRSPVRRSPTKLWILDLVRWTCGLGLIVIDKCAITVGLVSNLNNLWALLWAFA